MTTLILCDYTHFIKFQFTFYLLASEKSAIIFHIHLREDKTLDWQVAAYTFIFLLLCIVGFSVYVIIKRNNQINKIKKKYNAFDVVFLTHIYGLPLSEWLPCACYISKDKYVFYGDEKEFVLIRKSVTNKYLATDIAIQKQAVSNVKGTIAGAQAFGAIGALLASNAKVVDVKTVKRLLIFEYVNENGESKTLAFDISGKMSDKAAKHKFAIKEQAAVNL